ncbi:hypothetical protein GLOIN_2v1765633 [Rhizophagus irregularis DAOM 181602=DAOM 197198]|uniref:Uncharacterized protein n=1 Tax=Rhizophagus irregularis (strain DAOM 181602 / DAOM 197198 / MUCL 43194) TaxID=747089 RepID=A0A2P4QP99_RHIID|nr:hypothetical protein GLOIN_2v1765633 [Rhizophagus irregularis DAOM 181602=DAOM 197198]POG79388.1 hypothetical protein GLOIN_2v1765633 [Rhizophagus irregularis DAOM 181602=DAOM 197198]|eukprot:XP_025186254.1 hypothetical protein GLOIN_2v1765633 [Rhizophagus irregularis DAOM 181602=DAOM 197198]
MKPPTFLEWIPLKKLYKYLDKLYNQLFGWTWDHRNQEYRRSKVQVLVEVRQINEILNEIVA